MSWQLPKFPKLDSISQAIKHLATLKKRNMERPATWETCETETVISAAEFKACWEHVAIMLLFGVLWHNVLQFKLEEQHPELGTATELQPYLFASWKSHFFRISRPFWAEFSTVQRNLLAKKDKWCGRLHELIKTESCIAHAIALSPGARTVIPASSYALKVSSIRCHMHVLTVCMYI